MITIHVACTARSLYLTNPASSTSHTTKSYNHYSFEAKPLNDVATTFTMYSWKQQAICWHVPRAL